MQKVGTSSLNNHSRGYFIICYGTLGGKNDGVDMEKRGFEIPEIKADISEKLVKEDFPKQEKRRKGFYEKKGLEKETSNGSYHWDNGSNMPY